MTPTATTTATTIAEVLDAVDAFLPIVRDNVGRIRSGRRLPDDVELALRATGINRHRAPRQPRRPRGADRRRDAGARDASPPSTAAPAWCAIIGAGSNIFAGYLPPDGAREVFADPDRSSATMFAAARHARRQRRVGCGCTGRWPFVSNCLHAAWIGLVATRDVRRRRPTRRRASSSCRADD